MIVLCRLVSFSIQDVAIQTGTTAGSTWREAVDVSSAVKNDLLDEVMQAVTNSILPRLTCSKNLYE